MASGKEWLCAMKNIVPVVVQRETMGFYWVKNIFFGLKRAAAKNKCFIRIIEDVTALNAPDFPRSNCVIVVGYTTEWLYETLNYLTSNNFKPIIANPCVTDEIKRHCNVVTFQLEDSIEKAIKYLLSAGKKKIALLGTNKNSLADGIKENTFLNFFGVESEKMIFRGYNPLYKCVDEFIKTFSSENIDAAICSSDTVAIYLIKRMLDNGFNMPKDLYVIGMGNSKTGKTTSIPITTIGFDYKQLGICALKTWCAIQKDELNTHNEISIPCEFIIRDSTENVVDIKNKITFNISRVKKKYRMDNDSKGFFDDADVKRIISLEDLLISADKTDYTILKEIIKGNSDAKMSEHLNISDRAIRYRINKMFKILGVHNREDIVHMIHDLHIKDSNIIFK